MVRNRKPSTVPRNRNRATRSGIQAIGTSQAIRTLNVVSVGHDLWPVRPTVDNIEIIGSARWPVLKVNLDHVQEWRIRSARVTVNSLAGADAVHLIGVLIEPKKWDPSTWADLKGKGGVVKSCKSQDWSSNTIGAQEDWVKFDARAAVLYHASPGALATSTEQVLFTLHLVIQVRGSR